LTAVSSLVVSVINEVIRSLYVPSLYGGTKGAAGYEEVKFLWLLESVPWILTELLPERFMFLGTSSCT
jgi:hypothetical protein